MTIIFYAKLSLVQEHIRETHGKNTYYVSELTRVTNLLFN